MEGRLTADVLEPALRPLGRATTLPAAAFTSPAVYRDEVQRIFEHAWLCAGRVDQVPNPGDHRPIDLLGDKLVVVRGLDERVRVLSRVCRHRAAELISEAGNARSFRCPYHAWTYDLEGRLRGAPHMNGAENFDRATCRLPEVRSEIWEGWIFVNFDASAEPLGPQLAPLSAALASHRMSEMVAVETAVYPSAFNWKVLVDNFMEAYHHIATHRDTLEPVFPATASHVPDNQGPYALLEMPTRDDTTGFDPLNAAVVFPFHLFAPSGDGMAWYQLLPTAWNFFELRIYTCIRPEVLEDPAHGEGLASHQELIRHIHEQDIGACEAVFSGLQARSFDMGPLAPLEKTIWQFNQWWIDRMTGSDD